MIKSILVAIDGSEYTDPVLKSAIYLAKAFQSKLNIITVIDIRIFEWSVYLGVDGFAPVLPSSVYLDESRHLLQDKADMVLQKCVELVRPENIPFAAAKHEGNPVEIITSMSSVVDLIILGSHGEFAKWGGGKLMGATVEAISRECNKSMLICPKDHRPFQRILVPYDGSVNSNRALPLAGYFATHFPSELIVFSVDNNSDIANQIANEGKKYLDSYEIQVQIATTSGHADEEIIKFANEKKFDLIIMGAYGHSRIKEAILGSTTERVMRNAKIPLLLVK